MLKAKERERGTFFFLPEGSHFWFKAATYKERNTEQKRGVTCTSKSSLEVFIVTEETTAQTDIGFFFLFN